MRAATVVTAALLLSGCGLILDLDPEPPPASGAGDDSGVAPTADGGTADGGDESDVGVGTDAGLPPPAVGCGGPSAIQDGFDDGGSGWTDQQTSGGGTVTLAMGRAVFTVPAGTGDAQAGYISKEHFDAREDSIAVQAFAPDDMPDNAGMALGLFYSNGDHASIGLTSAGLRAVTFRDGGAEVGPVTPVPYDPIAHRWWKIGGAAGSLVFATSPDGVTWTTLFERDAPAYLESVRVAIGVVADGTVPVPVRAEFDDLGLEPAAAPEPRCPIDSYSDAFETELNPFRWARVGTEVECRFDADPSSGSLSIQPVEGDCGLQTLHAYDATDRALTLELARGPSSKFYQFELSLTAPGGAVVATCTGSSGNLREGSGSIAFPCEARRYLRLKHSMGQWHFELSDDGALWLASFSIPATVRTNTMVISILTRPTSSPTGADDALLLAHYNP